MIRTFVWVVVLTLAAGVALGFFAAEASNGRRAPESTYVANPGNPIDGAIEHRVRGYVEAYRLTPAQEQAIRAAFREYDRKLAALFRRLQLDHRDEFKGLSMSVNDQITAALAGAEKR